MPTPSLDELIQTVLDRSAGETELDQLGVAVEVSGELGELADRLLDHFVEAARKSGASWSRVGDALGISKQGAQQRFQRRPEVFHPPAGGHRRLRDLIRSPMFARFTDRARAGVRGAVDEARALGHAYIGTEHFLLSILRQSASVGVKALTRLEVDVDGLRRQIVALAGPASAQPTRGRPPFTPRAKRALELSLREALRMGHHYIGTEHVLIGLAAEGDGLAGRTLADSGVGLEELRDAVLQELAA